MLKTTQRLPPKVRRDQIMNAAVKIALDKGYYNITRLEVANAAGISEGSVSIHFGTMNKLKRALMRHAVKNGIFEIVAQGIAANDKHALKVSKDFKNKALSILLK